MHRHVQGRRNEYNKRRTERSAKNCEYSQRPQRQAQWLLQTAFNRLTWRPVVNRDRESWELEIILKMKKAWWPPQLFPALHLDYCCANYCYVRICKWYRTHFGELSGDYSRHKEAKSQVSRVTFAEGSFRAVKLQRRSHNWDTKYDHCSWSRLASLQRRLCVEIVAIDVKFSSTL